MSELWPAFLLTDPVFAYLPNAVAPICQLGLPEWKGKLERRANSQLLIVVSNVWWEKRHKRHMHNGGRGREMKEEEAGAYSARSTWPELGETGRY